MASTKDTALPVVGKQPPPPKASPDPDDLVTIQIHRSALTVVATPTKYMRRAESPAGPKAVHAAAMRGELTEYKPGKVVLVERAEHDAWIARHRVGRRVRKVDAAPADDLDAALGLARAGAAGGRR